MKKLIVIVSLSLAIVTANAVASDRKDDSPIVITLCQAMQGNGFNWAATISWISETFNIRSAEGKKLKQRTGRDVLFYINCAGGGSSGAATTALYGALLANPHLAGNKDNLYTPEEVKELSRALKYLAYSTDMTEAESVQFKRLSKADYDGTWWKGTYPGEMIIHTFGRRILLAGELTNKDLHNTLLSDSEREMITFDEIEDIPVKDEERPDLSFSRDYYLDYINKEANQVIKDSRKRLGGLTTSALDELNILADQLLLGTEAPDGLMTGVYGYLVDAVGYGELVDKYVSAGPPPFKKLRPVYFMNNRTLHAIIASKEYQRAVLDPNDIITKQIVLVGVNNLHELIAPSAREPYANPVEYKLVSAFGTTEYFDPILAIENKDKFNLKRVHFDTTSLGGFSFSRYLINVGGWGNYKTTERLLAFYMMAMHDQRIYEVSQDASHAGFLNAFGKYGTTTMFNLKVINKIFTVNDDLSDPGFMPEDAPIKKLQKQKLKKGALENLAMYYHHSFDFENNIKPLVESYPGANIEVTHVGMNWDKKDWKCLLGLVGLPAAFCDKGRDLTMIAVNFTRAKLNIDLDNEVNYLACVTSEEEGCDQRHLYKNSRNSFGWEFDAYHDRNYYYYDEWPEWIFEKMSELKLGNFR